MLMIDTLPDIHGLAPAMHGMRNPMNSWDRGDTNVKNRFDEVGPKDLELAKKLALGGPVHAKYRRMIMVWVDITAPLYWWKEFDTYKVGTVANSCSTMHKIQDKEFTLDDFSCEHLIFEKSVPDEDYWYEADTDGEWEALNDEYCGVVDSDFIGYNSFPGESLKYTITFLNRARDLYLKTKDKKYWWQMIQLLPSSYNQKRTVCLNYEVLSHIYADRRNHKLDEWHTFCDWIETLPHAEEMIFPQKEVALAESREAKRIYTIKKDALYQFVGYLADENKPSEIAEFIGIPESCVRMLLLDLGMEALDENSNKSE